MRLDDPQVRHDGPRSYVPGQHHKETSNYFDNILLRRLLERPARRLPRGGQAVGNSECLGGGADYTILLHPPATRKATTARVRFCLAHFLLLLYLALYTASLFCHNSTRARTTTTGDDFQFSTTSLGVC